MLNNACLWTNRFLLAENFNRPDTFIITSYLTVISHTLIPIQNEIHETLTKLKLNKTWMFYSEYRLEAAF